MLRELKAGSRTALIPLDVALQNLGFMPRRRVLADCILVLADTLLEDKEDPLQVDISVLHQFVCDYAIMNALCSFNEPFEQKSIWLILKYCDESQARSLFETILTHNLPVSSYTLLQFAAKFLGYGQAHVGFEIIRKTIKLGARISTFAMQTSCVKLLRVRPNRDDWYDYQNSVITELFQLGIRPNAILWTCIMQNAIEAGHFEDAWRWYNLGINDGLKPIRGTINALLKIAKHEKNEETLYRVIDEAHKAGVLPNDLEVVFDLLHAAFVIEQSKSETGPFQENAFPTCLQHYVQYCDIGPLQELGCELGPASEWQPRDIQLPAPTSRIIGMMIVAYIGRPAAWQDFMDFYFRYSSLVTSKHPLIAPLAHTDHISNAFLMRLGDRRETLHYCTTVIQSMIDSSPCGVSPSSELRSTTPNQTGQPTLQTWNILIRCYVIHGQTAAAEKVASMLEVRGFAPDRVTWNQLISGYVASQQEDKLIYAAIGMRDAGIEFNETTIKYLQRIVDKPRFFRALDDYYADSQFQVSYDADRPSKPETESQFQEDIVEESGIAQTDGETVPKLKVSLEYTD